MTRSLTRSPDFYDKLPAPVRAADGTAPTSPPDGRVVESAAPTGVECVQCAYSAEVHRLVWGPR